MRQATRITKKRSPEWQALNSLNVSKQLRKANKIRLWLLKSCKSIERFIIHLFQLGIPIEKSILFGSYTKGSEYQEPDIDLALWSPGFKGWVGVDMELFSSIMGDYWPIFVKTFHISETASQDPFLEEIEKTGKRIDLRKVLSGNF